MHWLIAIRSSLGSFSPPMVILLLSHVVEFGSFPKLLTILLISTWNDAANSSRRLTHRALLQPVLHQFLHPISFVQSLMEEAQLQIVST